MPSGGIGRQFVRWAVPGYELLTTPLGAINPRRTSMLVPRIRLSSFVAAIVLGPLVILGCAKKPPMNQAGFLQNYSNLESVNSSTMRYISPALKSYTAFIVDPIEFTVPPKKLSEKDRAEVARYFRAKLIEVLKSQQFEIVDDVGENVARIQIAMTDVANSTWWMKIHPASRVSGAGTGGAACEGEVIDSITGEQLAAWVRTSTGNQFNFLAFSTVSDVKGAIDKWAADAAKRLDEMRKSQPVAP
jgi:hypothetical protein